MASVFGAVLHAVAGAFEHDGVAVVEEADGRGACSGISMWRTLSLMVVFMGFELVGFR